MARLIAISCANRDSAMLAIFFTYAIVNAALIPAMASGTVSIWPLP